MASVIRPVTALLLSAGILLAGNGLEGVLLPLRGSIEGFSEIEIGLIGSAYNAGLMVGCIICPRILGRVGHIRAFAVFTAIATMENSAGLSMGARLMSCWPMVSEPKLTMV